ncbi:MAG: hypothetical protein ABUT39_28025 [Acidobacteriota bacterium]
MPSPRNRDLAGTRLATIRRRWPRYRWDYQGQSRWEGWTAERYLGLGIAAALGAATFLELSILTGQGDFGLARAARALALLAALVNVWMVDEWISSHTPGDRNLSGWLRLLRPLVAGVPVLGLATVPVWRWIATTRPSWAFQPARPGPRPGVSRPAPVHGLPARARRLVRTRGQRLPWLLLWVIACQIFPFVGGLSWLIGSGPLGTLHRQVFLLISAVLHLLAALLGHFYGRRQAEPEAFRLRALPWLLLLPGLGILSLAVLLPASFHPREEGLLVQTLCDRRWVEELPGDLFQVSASEVVGDAEPHRQAFFRLKTLLLTLDAAALSWLATRFLGWDPGMALTRSWIGIGLLALPALAGLLLILLGLAARWTGFLPALRGWERHALGRYLALVPVAFSSGLVLGSLLARGETYEAGRLLEAAGISLLFLLVVSLPLRGLVSKEIQSDSTILFWFLLWFEIEILGFILEVDPRSSLLRAIELAFLSSPALSPGLFLALGGWLLRPFTLRHLAGSAGSRSTLRRRLIVGGIALTAALPLGGLAVPFWICAHHRWWPGLEREWAERLP